MRSDELLISSIAILRPVFFLILTLKKLTSHTLSIAIVLNGQLEFFIQPYRIKIKEDKN